MNKIEIGFIQHHISSMYGTECKSQTYPQQFRRMSPLKSDCVLAFLSDWLDIICLKCHYLTVNCFSKVLMSANTPTADRSLGNKLVLNSVLHLTWLLLNRNKCNSVFKSIVQFCFKGNMWLTSVCANGPNVTGLQ